MSKKFPGIHCFGNISRAVAKRVVEGTDSSMLLIDRGIWIIDYGAPVFYSDKLFD